MRGSIDSQLGRLSVEVNQLGESKYNAKIEAREQLIAEGLSPTSDAVAERIGVFSAETMGNYMEKWQELGSYAKEEFGCKNLENLSPEMVKQFLADKLEQGVSYSHWSGYVASFGKLENALESFASSIRNEEKDYGFRAVAGELRPEASSELSRFEGSRAYDSPHNLVSNLEGTSQLVASVQLESGCRLSEASQINADQLKGLTQDPHTGKLVGQFDFNGKGGNANVANVSPETYEKLVNHITENGSLNHSVDIYRTDLKSASTASNQEYNGSHGLRWTFAQERMSELQNQGMGRAEALGVVSNEMGHNRIEITEHYLK